jgi:hypothetical protein
MHLQLLLTATVCVHFFSEGGGDDKLIMQEPTNLSFYDLEYD